MKGDNPQFSKIKVLILDFFDALRGVAVPSLATGAVPKMLFGFETASGAAVSGQGLGGMFQRLLHGFWKR
jgi:hypothetical protein